MLLNNFNFRLVRLSPKLFIFQPIRGSMRLKICIAVPIEVLVPQKLIRNCPFSNIIHISRAIFKDH